MAKKKVKKSRKIKIELSDKEYCLLHEALDQVILDNDLSLSEDGDDDNDEDILKFIESLEKLKEKI